jgi:hypothetical protein
VPLRHPEGGGPAAGPWAAVGDAPPLQQLHDQHSKAVEEASPPQRLHDRHTLCREPSERIFFSSSRTQKGLQNGTVVEMG